MNYFKKKKVVAYLGGGLGNQLFIYAAARTLSDQTGRALVLNVDAFPRDTVYRRTFELTGFHIRYDKLLSVTPKWRPWFRMARNQVSRQLRLGCWINERHHNCLVEHFFEKRLARTIGLAGYFQSEHYFCSNQDALISDLTLKDVTAFECTPEYQQIVQAEKSVFVHIRSYKDIPGKQDGSAALPIDYYHQALRVMYEKLGSFTAFVFSDDVAWAQQRLSVSIPIEICFVRPSEPQKSFDQKRDFYLMQCCQHGIVAESSFSWWARWLGEKRQASRGFSSITLSPLLPNRPYYYPAHWESIAFHSATVKGTL